MCCDALWWDVLWCCDAVMLWASDTLQNHVESETNLAVLLIFLSLSQVIVLWFSFYSPLTPFSVHSFSSHFKALFQLKHWSEATTPKSTLYVLCLELSFSFVSCCLHFSFMLLFISLSCSLHVFPLHVFHFSLVVLGCPFIFRSSSCNFPIIFLISRSAFSWSEAIIPISCSMFYVLSCVLVDGVHVLVIFLSFAIHLV